MINVKVERAKLDMTQGQFAKALGVSQGLVSKWEGGEITKLQESAIRWFLHKRKRKK
jgi:DNA-binding transcriptional regulator YiaG